MSKLKFDGKYLKSGSNAIANVRGDKICKGTGSNTVCNIRGDKICDGSGSNTEFNVRGDKICLGSGSNSIAAMKEVDKEIDGAGHVVKAALWLYFVR